MRKAFYIACLLMGLAIFVYFYVFNFDSMSETELVQYVLVWYVPFVFGAYGLLSLRIKKNYTGDSNALNYIFSGKDSGLLMIFAITLMISGVLGGVFLAIPMLLIKPKHRYFDLLIAIIATLIWVFFLAVFFFLLWDAL